MDSRTGIECEHSRFPSAGTSVSTATTNDLHEISTPDRALRQQPPELASGPLRFVASARDDPAGLAGRSRDPAGHGRSEPFHDHVEVKNTIGIPAAIGLGTEPELVRTVVQRLQSNLDRACPRCMRARHARRGDLHPFTSTAGRPVGWRLEHASRSPPSGRSRLHTPLPFAGGSGSPRRTSALRNALRALGDHDDLEASPQAAGRFAEVDPSVDLPRPDPLADARRHLSTTRRVSTFSYARRVP